MGKVIPRELCKKLKFGRANKWYMHDQESVQRKKLLWDFEIQTDHLISARWPDLMIVVNNNNNNNYNKRTGWNGDYAVPADHTLGLKENEKKDKYQDLAREQKTIEPESDVDANSNTVTKGLIRCLGELNVWGRMETIQTTALLRSARISRRVLGTWGD